MIVQNVLPLPLSAPFKALKFVPFAFLDFATKINKVGRAQQRILAVTDQHIYSCLPADGDIQRCLPLEAITEVHCYRQRNEVAIILQSEYDFLVAFSSSGVCERFLAVLPSLATVKFATGPLGNMHLRLERPAGFARAPPASVTVQFSKCTIEASGDPGRKRDSKLFGSGLQRQEQLFFDSASITAEQERERPVRPASAAGEAAPCLSDSQQTRPREWRTVFVSPEGTNSTPTTAVVEVQGQQGGDIAAQIDSIISGIDDSTTKKPVQQAPRGISERGLGVPSFAEFNDVTSVLGGLPPSLPQDFGQTESAQHIRNIFAEILESERENAKALRAIIDSLRTEVERLSLENAMLKRPPIDM